MTTPLLDLTAMFGEAWCVTLTRLPAGEALSTMGVATPTDLPDGLDDVTQRLTAGRGFEDRQVLLLARPVTPKWTMVVELEGAIGWIGRSPEVLADLCATGGAACTIMSDPNQSEATFAEDGRVLGGVDTLTGRRWGSIDGRLATALSAAGYPDTDDDDMTGDMDGATPSQGAVLAMSAATGVRLSADMFTGPWTGGLTAGA